MTRSHVDTIQERFDNRPFRVREAVTAGIPRQAIYRLRDDGLLMSVSRGVMQRADADPSMNAEFAVVAAPPPARRSA